MSHDFLLQTEPMTPSCRRPAHSGARRNGRARVSAGGETTPGPGGLKAFFSGCSVFRDDKRYFIAKVAAGLAIYRKRQKGRHGGGFAKRNSVRTAAWFTTCRDPDAAPLPSAASAGQRGDRVGRC